MQIQSQYSYSSSARKSLQQVFRSIISNEAYTKKGLSDEYKRNSPEGKYFSTKQIPRGKIQKRAQVVEEDIKEVIGLGKENDEATVVLETKQTKKADRRYQDLDCWNLL